MDLDLNLSRLRVQDAAEDDLLPFPTWASDIWMIGQEFGQLQESEQVQVTVLGLPRLEYAAGLLAAGIVAGRLDRYKWTQDEKDRHFELIEGLPDGSPLYVKKGDRVLHGKFRGIRQFPSRISDERHLAVQIANERGGNTTKFFDRYKVDSLSLGRDEPRLPMRPGGRRIQGLSRFISEWLGVDAGKTHVGRQRRDVLLIGAKARIRRELQEDFIRVKSRDGIVRGSLKEIIRPREFMPKSQGHASRLLSPRPVLSTKILGDPGSVLILDGAHAFKQARPLTFERSILVILRRGEPRFDDAVKELDQIEHTAGVSPVSPRRPASGAIEMYSFQIRRGFNQLLEYR